MFQISNQHKFILITLIVAGVVARVLNLEIGVFHLVPIGALALFGGYVLKNKRLVMLIPVATMLVSDIFLEFKSAGAGFYDLSQPFVYLGMAIFGLLGSNMKSSKILPVLGNTLLGSLLFWVVSNLGVFVAGYYGYSFAGFANTFAMALPFLKNDMNSNLLFFNPILVNIIVAQITFAVYNYATLKNKQVANA